MCLISRKTFIYVLFALNIALSSSVRNPNDFACPKAGIKIRKTNVTVHYDTSELNDLFNFKSHSHRSGDIKTMCVIKLNAGNNTKISLSPFVSNMVIKSAVTP